MKATAPQASRETCKQGNEAAQAEIQAFLLALNSYTQRFAADPRITFEQHRANLSAMTMARFSDPRGTTRAL
ncbi:MAG TPA: hypothetical protein VMD76_01705 [Candidatus Sulfotelmatobacter sp.]|jgi:hypothetical protein|nr:hypothetical protein [Candidatus Sulfotelmatobacter sp.]